MSTPGRLVEKRAIVTGAGSGIGRAIALRLAREGAHVAAVDIDRESAEATEGLIRDGGGTATALTVDLGPGRLHRTHGPGGRFQHGQAGYPGQ